MVEPQLPIPPEHRAGGGVEAGGAKVTQVAIEAAAGEHWRWGGEGVELVDRLRVLNRE